MVVDLNTPTQDLVNLANHVGLDMPNMPVKVCFYTSLLVVFLILNIR